MPKSRETTTRAIILARASAGEGSARVSFYTEAYGLIAALAKSAREERSKLRAHLQVGSCGHYTLVRGAHGWRSIGAVSTVNIHFALADNQPAQQAAGRVLSILRLLIHGEEQNTGVFSAAWDFLHALAHLPPGEAVTLAEYAAMVRILHRLGYAAPAKDIPHLSGATFAAPALRELQPFKGRLIKTIQDALFASGLS